MRRGLLFLNNRYHDPQLGVFISVDPLIAQTGEPYIYASGNPTTLSDPSGLDPDTSAQFRDRINRAKEILPSVEDTWEFARRLEMAFSDELGGDGTEEEWWAPTVGGELACRGLWACQAARTHLFDHPGDLAGARVIAAGFCDAGRCADGWFWNDLGDTMLRGATTIGVLVGSSVTTGVTQRNRPLEGSLNDVAANLSASEQRALRSLQSQIDDHLAKLNSYRLDPYAYDNLGILQNAPNDAVRQSIINGRIRHLETEIRAFQDQVSKLLGGAG